MPLKLCFPHIPLAKQVDVGIGKVPQFIRGFSQSLKVGEEFLITPKSNGDKSQTHHCQTISKNTGDEANKFEMKPEYLKQPGKQTSAEPKVA